MKQTMADQHMTVDQAIKAALGLVQENNFSEALKLVNGVLAQNPSHPDSLCLRGIIDLCQNRLTAAAQCFRRVLDLVPNHETAQHHLDQVEERMKAARSSPYLTEFVRFQALFMDYPRNIGIETVGRCNANCDFCPHESLDRKFTEMDDDLFHKIIGDLEEIPPEIPINIFPNLVNEPFMDRKIFPRLKTINQRLPQATLSIFTNFNVVHRNFFDQLAEIKNIRFFNVSFNAANEEEYETAMKIDFQRTVKNLKALMAKNSEETFFPGPVLFSRAASLSDADDRYVEECAKVFSEFTPGEDFLTQVKPRTNWLGSTKGDQSHIFNEMPCHAWFDFNIFCDGVVPHCCMDAKGDYSIGDVRTSSVLEIYNDMKFRFMREELTAQEGVHPCNNCSLLQ